MYPVLELSCQEKQFKYVAETFIVRARSSAWIEHLPSNFKFFCLGSEQGVEGSNPSGSVEFDKVVS